MRSNIFRNSLSILLSLLLSVMVAGCVGGNPQGSAQTTSSGPATNREYTTLYSDNTNLLYENPNRGFRGYMEVTDFTKTAEENVAGVAKWMQRHIEYAQAQTSVLYIYPWQYRGKALDDKFYETLQAVFDYVREEQIQICLRFAYYHTAYCTDRTPTTDEILLHIEDIAKNGIIERNKDVIHAFQVGFVGQFGEWHSENIPADREKVINSFIEKLLPDDVYAQVRMPQYKEFINEANADKKKIFGYHMDSFFGIQDSSQYGSGTYSIGLSDWETNVKEGAYTPQDGELYFHGQFVNDYGFFPDGYACLLGMSQLRMTTFSSENGYLEMGVFGNSAMQAWQTQPVTEKWLKEYGIPYAENWFKNAKGEVVERNVLEYIHDYLGYHFSATNLETTVSNNKLKADLQLKNYGFSSAFNITSKLVILDKDGKVISEAAAGNPAEWHSTDPDNYKNRKQLTHTVSAELELPTEKGEYSLALQLLSKSGAAARLDNNIPFEHSSNILHTFEIK